MKKKKIFCLFLGAAAVLLTGSLLALAEKTGSAEELQEGQRIARIRVVSIVGNELTYYEIEEESEEATTEETEEETEKQTEETADLQKVREFRKAKQKARRRTTPKEKLRVPEGTSRQESSRMISPRKSCRAESSRRESRENFRAESSRRESQGIFRQKFPGKGPETSSSEEVSEEASEKEPEMSSSEEASETFFYGRRRGKQRCLIHRWNDQQYLVVEKIEP